MSDDSKNEMRDAFLARDDEPEYRTLADHRVHLNYLAIMEGEYWASLRSAGVSVPSREEIDARTEALMAMIPGWVPS